MAAMEGLRALVRPVLDYALPCRCPVCGEIVSEPESLCAPCWNSLDFLGDPLCATCGAPLPGVLGAGALCGACLAEPPAYDRARAVTAYGEAARTLAHRLKYGRRTGHARIMARHIARLLPAPQGEGALLLVPVPLHRWRIWSRGFNQAALIARALAARSGHDMLLDGLRRTRNTPPLHALDRTARARVVKGAFALAPGAGERIAGRHVVLVDDIWTTGATVANCATVLRRAGAARIDVLCWSRALADSDRHADQQLTSRE